MLEELKKRNITLFDFLLLPFTTFIGYFHYYLSIVRKVVRNWPDIILFRLGIKKKLIIKLRNGKEIKIEKMDDYFNFWKNFWNSEESLIFLSKGVKFDKRKRQIEFKYKNHLIRLYSLDSIGSYKEQFI
jgi:hypothetical protein